MFFEPSLLLLLFLKSHLRFASSFSFTIVDVEAVEYVEEASSKVLVEVVVEDLVLLEAIVDLLFERGRRYIEMVF